MSQENINIVKAAIDALNREDWDAAFRDVAPDAAFDWSRAVGPWHGVFTSDQFRRVPLELREGWDSIRIEPHEFIEAGDLIVVPWTFHATGRDGIEMAARVATVWTIRDGTIKRVSLYQERQDALEDVGLSSEQRAHADT